MSNERQEEQSAGAQGQRPSGDESKRAGNAASSNSSSAAKEYEETKLLHVWNLWYRPPGATSSEWCDGLTKLATMSTAEGFWSVFWFLDRPSVMVSGSDYYIFKTSIMPIWHAEANRNGGRVFALIPRVDTTSALCADHIWMRHAVDLLSGQLNQVCPLINGIFVSIRHDLFRVGFWLSPAIREVNCEPLKQIVSIIAGGTYEVAFQLHNDRRLN